MSSTDSGGESSEEASEGGNNPCYRLCENIDTFTPYVTSRRLVMISINVATRDGLIRLWDWRHTHSPNHHAPSIRYGDTF